MLISSVKLKPRDCTKGTYFTQCCILCLYHFQMSHSVVFMRVISWLLNVCVFSIIIDVLHFLSN